MTKRGFAYWFSEDDLLNISYSVARGPVALTVALFRFWGDIVRPLPGLILYGLYHESGLSAALFNSVRFILCLFDLSVLGWFCWRLSKSGETVVYVLLLMGFHPALCSLYFDCGMFYDLLAFFFFYLGLGYYLKLRSNEEMPGLISSLAVIACCLAALDSKEIAVSFPLALLLFEVVLFRWQPVSWRRFLLPLATGVLAGGFAVAKMTGSEAMSAMPAYHPHASLSVYLDTYSHYLGQMLFLPPTSFRPFILEVLLAPCGLAILLRSKVLGWVAGFNLISILPIAFIGPRNAFAFFVPLTGWAISGATVIELLRRRLVREKPRLVAASKLVAVLIVATAVIPPEVRIMEQFRGPAVDSDGFRNKPYFDDLRAILPSNLAHRRVLALRHPFKLSWEFLFMLRLGWNDQTIGADTADLLVKRGEKVSVDRYDFVVDFIDGRFVLVPRQH